MKVTLKVTMTLLFCLQVLLLANCASKGVVDKMKELDKKDVGLENNLKLQQPGMGEMMNVIQARHARLWLAGQAGNWKLAEHQLKGIQIELEKAGKIYSKWEDVPKPLGEMITLMTKAEFETITEALRAGDKQQFTASFERLTNACNTCHNVTKRSFIVIQIPTSPGDSNMQYKAQ